MSNTQITNIRAEFSDEHMSESLLFEIDGTEYRELVSVWTDGFEMPDIRLAEDDYLPRITSLLGDNFDADATREIYDQLSNWISNSEGSYESGSKESEVTEVWHGLFKSKGFSIVLTEAAAKELDVSEGNVDVKFNGGYTVMWNRESDAKHHDVEFHASPDDDARAMAWAIRNPENVVLDAIRSRNEYQSAEAA